MENPSTKIVETAATDEKNSENFMKIIVIGKFQVGSQKEHYFRPHSHYQNRAEKTRKTPTSQKKFKQALTYQLCIIS